MSNATEINLVFTDNTTIALIIYHFIMTCAAVEFKRLIEKLFKKIYDKIKYKKVGF